MFKYLAITSMVLGCEFAQAKKEEVKTDNEPQSQIIKESKEEKYQVLGMIFKIHQLPVPSFGGSNDGASIDAAKKSIIIEESQDYMDDNGEIKNKKITYGIRYDWKADGTVKDTLTTYKIK